MAKTTKKQQARTLKKQKERADKRRHLRHASQSQFDAQPSLPASPPVEANTPEQMLRTHIQTFALHKRFSIAFEKAFPLFFGKEAARARLVDFDKVTGADFQEWYFFDFVTDSGQHLIDLFAAEVGPSLPPEQQQILQDWMGTNRLRLLEVQTVTPGVGETAQDIISGEVFHANDISLSHVARRWTIVVARTLLTQGRWHFTGGARLVSPLQKDRLLDFVGSLWHDYQQQAPQATLADFYRLHSLQLRKFVAGLLDSLQHPVYRTAENHARVRATAVYRVRDGNQVLERLDATEEFVYVGDSQEKPGAEHYKWLQRGRSHVPEAAAADDQHAILLRNEWTIGPGHTFFRSLGDLTVTATVLELNCLSRERLTAGRPLLEQVLEGLLTHRGDHFADIAVEAGRAPAAPTSEQFDRESRQVTNEMMAREMANWLDMSVPKLNDQTPRQAANSVEGRARLEELLKIMEYYEDIDPQRTQTPFTAQAVRRELGLT